MLSVVSTSTHDATPYLALIMLKACAFCPLVPPPPPGMQIKAALALWDGTGSFVFTSSMSVCSVDDGGRVTEDACPLVAKGAGPSTDKLLGAEEAVLQVVRACVCVCGGAVREGGGTDRRP